MARGVMQGRKRTVGGRGSLQEDGYKREGGRERGKNTTVPVLGTRANGKYGCPAETCRSTCLYRDTKGWVGGGSHHHQARLSVNIPVGYTCLGVGCRGLLMSLVSEGVCWG